MTRDDEYSKRKNMERMRQNIIKWWNVKDDGIKNFIGSLELEDPLYGCPVYASHKETVAEELPEMDSTDNPDSRDPVSQSVENDSLQIINVKDEEAVRIANEIYARLQREAESDAKRKEDEIAAAKKAYENDANYNATTNSYSGLYGQTPMNEEEKKAYDAIMAQNSNNSRNSSSLFQNQYH